MATAALPEPRIDPLVEPALTRGGAARVDAIDMLRGLVIALMVLDHIRDYFHADALAFDPTDPARSWPMLFATRWVTHLCATTFVFLAGVSIYFQRENGKAPADVSRFLLTRGAWLIFLEATLVSFGFNFAAPLFFFQVIWAIGASMIAMAALTRLPARAVLAIGAGIVLLHLLVLLALKDATGIVGVLARFAFVPGMFPGAPGLVYYPFVPWLGVMCLGYGLGGVFRLPPAERRRRVLLLGAGMLAAFLILRGTNIYGDVSPWQWQADTERTVMAFLNLNKYPPSPDYVLATLGVSLLLFVALERLRGPLASVLLAFGRTPLFTYLIHIYIAHAAALLTGLALGYPASTFTDIILSTKLGDAGWGFSLPVVYAVWIAVLVALYPLSRWFAGVKQRRRDWWLSYL